MGLGSHCFQVIHFAVRLSSDGRSFVQSALSPIPPGALPQVFLTAPTGAVQIPVSAVQLHPVSYTAVPWLIPSAMLPSVSC